LFAADFFCVNYGIVEYVDSNSHRANLQRLPNPVEYTYFKSNKFQDEREFRISLSALGIGDFVLDNGRLIDFSKTLQMSFDFRAAMVDGTIREIRGGHDIDRDFLHDQLQILRIKLHQQVEL